MTADTAWQLVEAFAFIFTIFGLVPMAILAAYYAGERSAERRRYERHVRQALRVVGSERP